MPTYYNGKEITSTSIMSGVNLTGKSSIIIGGKVITLSTPPPPPEMTVYGDSGDTAGYPDPATACRNGAGGYPLQVFIQDNGDGTFSLFLDNPLTDPLMPGWWWSDDATMINSGLDVSILLDPNGRVVFIQRCS